MHSCVHKDVIVSHKFMLVYECVFVSTHTIVSIPVGTFLDICMLTGIDGYICVVSPYTPLCISLLYQCTIFCVLISLYMCVLMNICAACFCIFLFVK